MSIADLKHQELPLARIKKIMKLDEDVKVSGYNLCWCFLIKTCQMISAEAPVLFAKAAEMFIHELTMRAWIHTEVGFFFHSAIIVIENGRTTREGLFRGMTLPWQSQNTTSLTSS